MLIKLKNSQLSAFNDYLGAIQNDFRGTLGRTDYNGGTPPYISGSESGSHNCTSWVSTWARANVSNAIPYGAYPPGWVERMARTRSNASAYRGLVVFNHPDAPHTGQRVARNFELEFGYGND